VGYFTTLQLVNYIASNGRITDELKGCGRKRSKPNLGICPEGMGKSRKTSVRVVSVSAEIRTEHLPKIVAGTPIQPVRFSDVNIRHV
jgi:hypothetical protein